jgi:hypothetical protein
MLKNLGSSSFVITQKSVVGGKRESENQPCFMTTFQMLVKRLKKKGHKRGNLPAIEN